MVRVCAPQLRHGGRWVVPVLLAVFLGGAEPAAAQDSTQQLVDRLDRLERDIRTLHRSVARGAPPPAAGAVEVDSSAVGRFTGRLDALEQEVRSLTGRMETITHGIDELNKRFDKLIADVDYRLGALERRGTAGAAPSAPPTGAMPFQTAAPPPPQTAPSAAPSPGAVETGAPSGSLGTLTRSDLSARPAPGTAPSTGRPAAAAVAPPPSVLPEGGPKEQYDYSIGLLRQNRFDEAEAALKAFLDRHGGHALAGNARYWLGETYYVRADYMNAAATFLESYRKEPKGSKAPDSLLKLGMSLINLEKPKEACSTLAKLDKEYPDAPDNVRAVAARERARAKCK